MRKVLLLLLLLAYLTNCKRKRKHSTKDSIQQTKENRHDRYKKPLKVYKIYNQTNLVRSNKDFQNNVLLRFSKNPKKHSRRKKHGLQKNAFTRMFQNCCQDSKVGENSDKNTDAARLFENMEAQHFVNQINAMNNLEKHDSSINPDDRSVDTQIDQHDTKIEPIHSFIKSSDCAENNGCNSGHTNHEDCTTNPCAGFHQVDMSTAPHVIHDDEGERHIHQHGVENGGYIQSAPQTMKLHGVQHIHHKPIHITRHFHVKPVVSTLHHNHEKQQPKLVAVRLPKIHRAPVFEVNIESQGVEEGGCENGGSYLHMTRGEDSHCICLEGYIGHMCEEINHCLPNPCDNEGSCNQVKNEPFYTCQCKVGFFGPKCDQLNPCTPNPCKNQAVCSHNGNQAKLEIECICPIKYHGKFCEMEKNCEAKTCQNNGQCTEGVDNKFHCNCEPPWRGPTCAEPGFCYNNPCSNGGTCRENGASFVCDCPQGYSGTTCNEHICQPNPCSNGGTCIEEGDHFKCACPKWTAGLLCEDNRPCQMHPCQNGGKCVDGSAGFQWSFAPLQYYCLCKPPYRGIHCEHHGCKNCDKNAHCIVDHCVCDEGFHGSGEVCRPKQSACHPNPCFNNGVCKEGAADCEGDTCTFTCICPSPFTPPLCREKNPCNPNPCLNGECQPVGGGSEVTCKCYEGFKGKYCDELEVCKPNPCQHQGVCRSVKGKAECSCKGMWRSPFCKECGCPAPKLGGIPDMSCDANGACVCPALWLPDMDKGLCVKKGPAQSCGTACCGSPCDNGGVCTDLPDGDFKCACKPRFTGKVCQFKIVCNPGPCENNGVCTEKDGKFLGCKCAAGFLPPFCKNTDPSVQLSSLGGKGGLCTPNPCSHEGVCVLNKGGYDCICLQRYTGPHCQVDKCANCHKNARCVVGECKCNPGFIGNGLKCEQDVCEETCVEWATCIQGNCVCPPGNAKISHKCIQQPTTDPYVMHDIINDVITKPTPTFIPPLSITHQTRPTENIIRLVTTTLRPTTTTPAVQDDEVIGPPSAPLTQNEKTLGVFRDFVNTE